jgi:hypothetical protein
MIEEKYTIQVKRKDTLSRIIHGDILHKAAHKKGKRPDILRIIQQSIVHINLDEL